MRYPTFSVLASFCLCPVALCAAEPSRGTVIMVSSIGCWVLLSSGSVVMREMRRAREKSEAAAVRPKQPKN